MPLPHRRFDAGRLLHRVLAVLLAVLLTIGTATAAHADDGRAPTPDGEVAALYRHGLGRAPDPAGAAAQTRLAGQSCEGLLQATWNIMTSAEATRFLNRSDRIANAMYMALLNRQPDAAGWQLRERQVRLGGWTLPRMVAEIMSSSEYIQRTGAICGQPTGHQAVMFDVAQSGVMVRSTLKFAASVGIGCAASKALGKVDVLARTPLGVVAGASAQLANTLSQAGSACSASAKLVAAAGWAAAIATRDQPVYWSSSMVTKRHSLIGHRCTQTVHVGQNPVSYATFVATWNC